MTFSEALGTIVVLCCDVIEWLKCRYYGTIPTQTLAESMAQWHRSNELRTLSMPYTSLVDYIYWGESIGEARYNARNELERYWYYQRLADDWGAV